MLNRWGLRRKVLVGFGSVLLLIVLVFGWAIHNLLQLGRASEGILSENYQSILAAENMIDAIERQDSGVLLFILGYQDEGVEQFQENERKFLQWFSRARDNITIPGEERIVERIDSSYAAYLASFTKFMQTSAATGQRQAQTYHDLLLPAFMTVRNASTDLRELNQHRMYEASETTGDVSHAAILSMTAVGLLAIALALAFSIVLANRIIRPVGQMQSAAVKIAEGNYDVEVPSETTDELGQLANQFNVMAARLRAYRDLNVEQIVAEKRKSEAIIRSIDDGIIAVNADLRVMDMNPTAAALFGIDAANIEGSDVSDLVGNGNLYTYIRISMENGTPPQMDEKESYLRFDRDGKEVHFQYTITPVRTPGGAMLGTILLLRDVTHLKELDRLKSEFVAMASHELQTPLTSIGMSIGLLEERIADRLNNGEMELLEVAREDVDRLRFLVRDLLDLSKIEAGKIDMELESVPVKILFQKAVETLRSQAEERSIVLTWHEDDNTPSVLADANKITWVLTNLIANGLRYTDPAGHVRLDARPAGNKVHLSVEDDGRGIPYEYQPTIFEKFVQVGDAASRGGTGLGLAICKEIVRAHGGSIWVDSIPGGGSTFTFTLPISQEDRYSI